MPYYRENKRTRGLFYFLTANYILALIIALPYLSYGPATEDFGAWVYTRVAFLSTFAIFMVLLGLLLYPLTRLIRSPIQLFILPPAVLFLFQALLLVDVQIYKIFRFHINGLVINTLMTEGAGDSVQIGRKTVLTLIMFLVMLIAVEWGAMWGIVRYTSRQPERVLRYSRYKMAAFILPLFLSTTIVSDKLIFAYANFYDMTDITRYQKLFPLYLPLFADETIEKYLGWKKEKSTIEYQAKSSMLNYPSPEFTFEDNLKPVNIVWIAIESWRFDMLNEQVTPNIKRFSENAIVFENHYSGGNASRFGIYSMFYGVYGTYWHQFLAERKSPVFLDLLQKMGYDFKILSSTQLTYPEFRRTAFVNLPSEAIDDRLPGKGGNERDTWLAKRFDEFITNHDNKRPFFSFMFLDSPHAPYRYPDNFAKFQPAVDEINYFEVKKANAQVDQNHPLFNRYRNSIYFTDSVVSRIIADLKKADLMDSTVVIITGDHGEEFDETGYYGHTSAFSDYQVKVPFILHLPGGKPATMTNLTSHLDVVPTMLSLMGSRIDPSIYSHGRSLFSKTENPYVVSSGWDTFAIIDPGATIILSTEIYKASTAEVRVGKYQLARESRPVLNARGQELLEVSTKLSNFLK